MSLEWALLPDLSAPMSFQMALDEILFRKFLQSHAEKLGKPERPLLRFYYSSEPWITLGYAQNTAACNEKNIPVTKRITGGGQVLHGKDVIFSIITHKSTDDSFRSVEASYRKIHEAVRRGFEFLGFKADFYDPGKKMHQGRMCFLFPIATDLSIRGKKVAGGAQKRSSGCLLHQESVSVPKGLAQADLAKALRKGFESQFQIRFSLVNLDLSVMEEAKIKTREKENTLLGKEKE